MWRRARRAALTVGGLILVDEALHTEFVRTSRAYWRLSDQIAKDVLPRLDPENAHALAVLSLALRYGPLEPSFVERRRKFLEQQRSKPSLESYFPDSTDRDPLMHSRLFGLDFPNPVGMAAGFDKNAVAVPGLLGLGFGFVEVGGVTPKPQPGNPKPRLFRLREDQAIINRFGLNSAGFENVKILLKMAAKEAPGIVGVNLAKNTATVGHEEGIADYTAGVRELGPLVDYVVLNVSCPNVGWSKEMTAHDPTKSSPLRDLVKAAAEERNASCPETPLLLKIGPDSDISELKRITDVAQEFQVDGFIVSNTSALRPESLVSENKVEKGGLSGRPLKANALKTLRAVRQLTEGKIPIVAVGGVEDAADAYERIRNGASLVQIYTTMVYNGPSTVTRIRTELAELLKRDGYENVADAIGVDAPIEKLGAGGLPTLLDA